ncbi:serine/threonine protein phosphatase [Hymenobacter busanensis]|uniref:Serine/threonine protein phosphatase n=1 Tax=Hymenobacter busanensis TaxID=2607656 RepID=A0A7L4ZZ93_9BACT|nr:metallophosphoesterase family protein [Hymenobacter busanensis]KAA9333062.1 serine/threonine protein phosphatase [Hymenobacter busanensis]QHJ08263.1 serine/threonine protein phosphatase [Hymenobacter busanensis]
MRYAATDLHGCLRTFRRLVEDRLQLTRTDTLYLLGDYVNKGPDSRGVLDYLMQLQADGYHVYCLLGNHDLELLDAARGNTAATWASPADRALTLHSFGVADVADIPLRYLTWLAALPLSLELPDFVLVHAGFDFRRPPADMRADTHTMLNIKSFTFDASRLQGKRLLHGHVPIATAEAQHRVAQRAGAIDLDTGCVYRLNPELNHLAALNLDTWELLLQQNVEQPYSMARRPAP